MEYDKSIIGKLIDTEDWSKFEEFIQSLYKNNEQAIEVIKNYKANAKSGRIREIDVLVKFGLSPHIILLGIECKYWNKKVDGDILDIVKNKKDDLGIDKFVVITTVGYERGAELYAKDSGIDLFIIRPTNDDDFGYSGKNVNFRFLSYGSAPTNICLGAQIITESNMSSESVKYITDKLSFIEIKDFNADFDHDFDLYSYDVTFYDDMKFKKLNYKNNLYKIIFDSWKEYNELYYKKLECRPNIKIEFKSNSALFFQEKNIIVIIKELTYHIRFFLQKWNITLDRSEKHPIVLENIIEKAITPLKKTTVNDKNIFEMDKTIKIEPIDIAKKPPDVIGREGVDIKYLLEYPVIGPFKNDENNKTFELIEREGKTVYEIVEE